MSTSLSPSIDVTTIRIVNEVVGTVTSKVSPQSISEAMKCDGDVQLANDFICFQDFRDKNDKFFPLGCCILKSNGRGIVVHWHPTGNIDLARDAWEEAQQDDWRVSP